ncbi:GIY-YIG nuclease family protein [Microbaculum sp. FT89]|uniref:GIY-YIG nuclease family protein n=1 Tax=Microbaculum sp. FT89 TaxID=3447298 RepID=UPI003F53023A
MDGYWVYILASRRRGTLYIGVTANIARRIFEHRSGLADGYTRKYDVKRLVHAEPFADLDAARRREHQLKGWRRHWKIALIETANPDWDDLFERFNH